MGFFSGSPNYLRRIFYIVMHYNSPILYFKKKAKEAHDERDGIKDRKQI